MPRLANKLIARAQRAHPYLVPLLRTCRTFESARNELRWLAEYIKSLQANFKPGSPRPPRLWNLCWERGRGRPLQYILGTQPFGELEILCHKGVLIPRPETEALVSRLAISLCNQSSLRRLDRPLVIMDAGTGTGCIALLLYARLYRSHPDMVVYATDVSPMALGLTRRNIEWNISRGALPASARRGIRVAEMDITQKASWTNVFDGSDTRLDVLVSNPPYISNRDFLLKTERSVRLFEPRLALIGWPKAYNAIHAWLIKLALWSEASIALFEVDSGAQAVALVEHWASHEEPFPENTGAKPSLGFDFWDGDATSILKKGDKAKARSGSWLKQTRGVLIISTEHSGILGEGVEPNEIDHSKSIGTSDLQPFLAQVPASMRLSPEEV